MGTNPSTANYGLGKSKREQLPVISNVEETLGVPSYVALVEPFAALATNLTLLDDQLGFLVQGNFSAFDSFKSQVGDIQYSNSYKGFLFHVLYSLNQTTETKSFIIESYIN